MAKQTDLEAKQSGAEYYTAAGRVVLLATELQSAIADLRDVAKRQAVPTILGPVGAGFADRLGAVVTWILQDWRKAEPASFAMHPQPCGASMATNTAGQPGTSRKGLG